MDQRPAVDGGEPAGEGEGGVRYRHVGEGEYERSEEAVQELLAETGARGVARELVSVAPGGAELAADWGNVKWPETYVGSDRSENRVSSGARLRLKQWALDGHWTVQGAGRGVEGGERDLVMAPGAGGKPVRFQVLVDGQAPGPRMDSTWTNTAVGPLRSLGCISCCGSRDLSPTAGSRSDSSIRV